MMNNENYAKKILYDRKKLVTIVSISTLQLLFCTSANVFIRLCVVLLYYIFVSLSTILIISNRLKNNWERFKV